MPYFCQYSSCQTPKVAYGLASESGSRPTLFRRLREEGVTFEQARKLIHGLVRKGRVVGMDVVEITPRDDVNQITCITAGRLIVNLIGMAVRAGYFDRGHG